MRQARVEPSPLSLATIVPGFAPLHGRCAADELYGIGVAPYDEVMASRSKDASLEITLLVLLIVLVVITVLTFLT